MINQRSLRVLILNEELDETFINRLVHIEDYVLQEEVFLELPDESNFHQ